MRDTAGDVALDMDFAEEKDEADLSEESDDNEEYDGSEFSSDNAAAIDRNFAKSNVTKRDSPKPCPTRPAATTERSGDRKRLGTSLVTAKNPCESNACVA